MVNKTPNIHLNIPDFGVPGWDGAVNENWASIDATIAGFFLTAGFSGAWMNSTAYNTIGVTVFDSVNGALYSVAVAHTSAAFPTTFAQDRAAHPSYWTVSAIAAAATAATAAAAAAAASAATASTAAGVASASATSAFSYASSATTQASSAAASALNSANSALAALSSQLAAQNYATNAANSASAASGNKLATFRNFCINMRMQVQQRGQGPWSTNGAFMVDRWRLSVVGDIITSSAIQIPAANTTPVSDQSLSDGLQMAFVGAATAPNFIYMTQAIEDVRIFSAKVITVSFYAYSTSNMNVGLSLSQYFGTGGSPSAGVATSAQTVAITSTMARKTATFTLASTTAKTLGANNDHSTILTIAFSSGTTNAGTLGVGAQSNTVVITGVQVEIANAVSNLEIRPLQVEYALCQRYFQASQYAVSGYAGSIADPVSGTMTFPVHMRATPSITVGSTIGSQTNVGGLAIDNIVPNGFRFTYTATAAGLVVGANNYTATAEL